MRMLLILLAIAFNGVSYAATLTGTIVDSSATVDLAQTGTLDWARWPGYQHKSNLISDVTVTGQSSSYDNDPRLIGNRLGIRAYGGTSASFQFTAQAQTTERTLIYYIGGRQAGGRITASLPGAPDFTTTFSGSTLYSKVVTIKFKADAAATLRVRFQLVSGSGSIRMQAVALQEAAVAPPPPTTTTTTPPPTTTNLPPNINPFVAANTADTLDAALIRLGRVAMSANLSDYEPWLFDRSTAFYKLGLWSNDATLTNYALTLVERYYGNIDLQGNFILKPGDTKYAYTDGAVWYEKRTGNTIFRPKAEAVYRRWLSAFSSSYSTSQGFWTEREIAYALGAALGWYELSNDPAALTRARALVQQWATMSAATGAPLHTLQQHGEESAEPYASLRMTSPWMAALFFEYLQHYERLTGDSVALQLASNYGDFLIDNCLYDGSVNAPSLSGYVMAYYMCGDAGTYYDRATPSESDGEHGPDLMGVMAFAVSAKRRLGLDATAAMQSYTALRRSAAYFVGRLSSVSPPRKINWWMGSSYDSTALVGTATAPTTTTTTTTPTTTTTTTPTTTTTTTPPPTTTTTTTTTTTGGPTISLNPTTYAVGGYSTISWNGTGPCTASAVPTYSAWSGSKSASWSQSVAPDVSTAFTITCANGAASVALTVTGGTSTAPTTTTTTTTQPTTTTTTTTTPPPTTTTTTTTTTTSPTGTLATAVLRTARPFIPLDIYTTANTAAVDRLRAQVDDVVTVTNRFMTSGTYDQLVSALNSGHYGYSAADSVIMFKLTGDQRYIQQAVRMVDLYVQSESALIAAGQRASIAGDSYLEVGPYMEQLALAYDYGYNLLTPAQRAAWSAYAEQTIYNVWNPNSARWGGVVYTWSGWSISDPGNNYHYSFLKATELWAAASQSATWVQFLQTQKLPQLVAFFAELTGGGTREGTGYGTAIGNLFEDYAYWKGAASVDLAAASPHARQTLDYWIHATVPTMDYFASIGDQSRSSMPMMFDYQRKLMALGVALDPSTPEARRGTWWLNRVKVTDGGSGWLTGRMRYNYDFKYDLLSAASAELAPAALMYDASGVGVVFARSDWSTSASWMHTVAGPYDQSHAHQDQGSFSFYRNGWLTVTANTRSSSGIEQGVDMHNVIRFGSIGQRNSTSTKTVTDVGGVLTVAEDLSPAYAGTAVTRWQRELAYTRATHTLAVHDVCQSTAAPVWQLQTPVAPVRQADGSYLAGRLRITPVTPAAPTVAIVPLLGGYRLELTGPGCEFQVVLQAQ